ncbi:MAG: TatD family hydrolase [Oscillospiraceae bacterium]|jgi:TatD DNase family protein|nr:TatD family hydrolase [Oscillospiraceae bacterium]
MHLADIGANLLHRSFAKDREQVLRDAKTAGVDTILITGTSLRESREAAQYVRNYPGTLYATAGVHPHDAKSCDNNTIGELRELADLPEVVAIGECGLDYDRDFSPRAVQRKWLERQVELAKELNMPLFLHEREAFADFRDILKNAGPETCKKAVVHCFTGSEDNLMAYLSLGCSIGITGWICDDRRGLHLRQAVKKIPADRLMIETDSPYLVPRNMRPRASHNRNEPKYLLHIARDIARCRQETTDSLARITYENTMRFFGLNAE